MEPIKPIILYSHAIGPNPWKCALVMEELSIPYENKFLNFKEVKEPAFLAVNPNGRVPAIHDPNKDLTLWESGAIVEYLVETYDKENKISYTDFTNKYLCKQWLHFQMSGQGPYYGQVIWFTTYAKEDIPLAINRYKDEMRRVTGVLERALDGRDWLVGDKYTYADLSFHPWQRVIPRVHDEDFYDKFPRVKAWMDRMDARPA
ncbi:glutathione S-transferase, partial [Candidatus Bathyarchaeota archaeon]|nr:glutathione S-transferase [Candidatus Bathyarchaeota archaeon]